MSITDCFNYYPLKDCSNPISANHVFSILLIPRQYSCRVKYLSGEHYINIWMRNNEISNQSASKFEWITMEIEPWAHEFVDIISASRLIVFFLHLIPFKQTLINLYVMT